MKYSLLGFSVWKDEKFLSRFKLKRRWKSKCYGMKLLPRWAFSIVEKWLSQWAFQLYRRVDFMVIAIMCVEFGKNLLDGSEDDAL